jgi:hypothetical protein
MIERRDGVPTHHLERHAGDLSSSTPTARPASRAKYETKVKDLAEAKELDSKCAGKLRRRG